MAHESFVIGNGSSANVACSLHIIGPLSRLSGTGTRLITALRQLVHDVVTALWRLVHAVITAAATTIIAQRIGYLTPQHWIHDDGTTLDSVVGSVFLGILDYTSGLVCRLADIVDSAVDCGLICFLDSGVVCRLASTVDSGVVCRLDSGLVCGLDGCLKTCVSIPTRKGHHNKEDILYIASNICSTI